MIKDDTKPGIEGPLPPWYRRIIWVPAVTLVLLPTIGFISAYFVKLRWETALLTIGYVALTMFCITGGYHRLWSHKSYTATPPLKVFLALFGCGALQGPIRWWAREHRAHHRYTDTDEDPYNIQEGLMHAHIGWMLFAQPKRHKYIDIADLRKDAVVEWQYNHYPILAPLMAWVFPTVVAGMFWDDWLGGLVYGGIIRMFITHHNTFFINSAAHYFGDQPYGDRRSARNSWFLAFLTLGEGYHNFHHQFPSDFRNGVKWNQFDFTKWCIMVLKMMGLASDLKRFRAVEIQKAQVQQEKKVVVAKEERFDWGPNEAEIPMMDWEEFQEECREDTTRALICVEGAVHDLTGFVDEHPGGRNMIKAYVGKDATAAFTGGIYKHSEVARNILAVSRIGVLRGNKQMTEQETQQKRQEKDEVTV